jgi:hypothetical protein
MGLWPRPPQWVARHPTQEFLSQPYLKLPFSLQDSINTCRKTLPFDGSGKPGRLRRHIHTISFVFLHPPCAHLNISGTWVQIKWVFLPNSSQPLIFMRFVKLQQNDFLKRKKKIISLSLLAPLILAKAAYRMSSMLWEKECSHSDLELGGIRKYYKSPLTAFLLALPALE